ncbi:MULTISPECIES: hypothetical protein [Acinetobacter]|uniref:hypothetical protein n=1 Tax=Acinetobacter TaxID=469 RepID=UPI001898E740|nr:MULTISPECIES: hypothetical protein [Acinetobacter]MBF6745453.1 hypothetical protein [Acinetobacter baumannii]MBF6831588.1 hypothetical protein [Acinetobacter baumannii]MBF6839074.1 hypothetical protein [Acinetobacter baumannii]MBF6929458.1 hypothetical protein [Acinetobacter baumannii]MCO9048776.1 hypothetical protein [Acinetobacter sp. UC24323]
MVIILINVKNQPSPVDQINEAIELISEAVTSKQLDEARNTATAFIDAAYESEDINLAQKHQLLKKVRTAYRIQYIGAAR